MSSDAGPIMAGNDDIPLERIEVEIMSWSGNLAAATARLLAWIAEYDRREGWKTWSCRSCAEWMSWKCGESLHTAREKVRVARALESLPAIRASFAAGELSYSKVRAVTRVATAADDEDWLIQARHSTGSELDRIVSGVRKAIDENETRDARVAHERRRVVRVSGNGGMSHIKVDAPTDAVATIAAAIEVVASRMIDGAVAGSDRTRRDVIAERGGLAAVRADALLQIAEQALAAEPAAAERGDVGRLQLIVDTDTLAEIADGADGDPGECTLGGERIAPEVARRWACDIRASVVVDHEGHGCDEGRETRVINRRLRRALHRRDRGMCRFPGCGAGSWLHAHHIVHWVDGGPTELANLVLLCGHHHSAVHEGGWSVALTQGAVVWSDPEGTPATVEPLEGDARAVRNDSGGEAVPASAIESIWHRDPLDFRFAVSVIAEHCLRVRAMADVPAGTSAADEEPSSG